MQGIKEILELKRRITSSGLIVSVLHLPDVSGMTTVPDVSGMARDRKKSASVLHMSDMSGMSTGRVRYCRN